MILEKIDKVPSFKRKDLQNKEVNILDYKGEKVLLSFFRDVSCPFTSLWIEGLNMHKDYFEENGLKVIGVFNSSKEEIETSKIKDKLYYPVIADPKLKLYKQFGISEIKEGKPNVDLTFGKVLTLIKSGKLFMKTKSKILPAEFLIDEDQKIFKAHYGKNYDCHIDKKEIIKWIKPKM